MMDLACGCQDGVQVGDVREMVKVGAFVDRYQMADVAGAVEEAIVRSLTMENCGEVLRWGESRGGRCLSQWLQLASWGWIVSQSYRGVEALVTSARTYCAV